MTNNHINHGISSSVGFQPCNTNSKLVNKVEDNGHSKLWNAILNKAPFEEIKKMIENGADLNEMGTDKDFTDENENHEVFYTCYAHPDCFELVKLFIEKGYDYKKITRNGLNAVSNFAGYFDSRVFFYLYSLDNNLIFDEFKDKFSILHYCIGGGSFEILQFLEEKGADLKANYEIPLLFLSVYNNDLRIIKHLLEDIKLPYKNEYTEGGQNLMSFACSNASNPDILKYLVSMGFNIDSLSPEGNSLLFDISLNPHPEIIKEYLELGGDINEKDCYGNSVFPYVVRNNSNPEIIDYLIKKNLFIKDKDLIFNNIVANDSFEVWKRLFELGFPKDTLGPNGVNLLMAYIVIESPNPKIVEFLANEINVNSKDEFGFTACHYAADKTDSVYYNILQSKGALLNEKNNSGVTPLMIACSNNCNPFIHEFLLKNGADISERDCEGDDALLWAMKNPNDEIIKVLIEHGANIHTKNRNGENILIKAIRNGASVERINYLLSLGIDLNEKDIQGMPAIVYAAYYHPNPEIIEFLVQKGANINYLTDKKENILIFAARNNPNEEVIDYLLNKGLDKNYVTAEGETPILAAAQNSNVLVMDKLIEKGANLDAVDNDKRNVLFIASKCNNNPGIISLLIEKGIPVNYRDNFSNNAILYAAQNGNVDIIKTLVEKGADLNSVNDAGITALMSALLEGNNNVEMIKYLIENGIDVNAKNADNITAMMMASASISDPEIIKLFITAGADISEEDNNGYDAYKIAKEYNPNPAIAETIKKYALMNNTKESILNIPTNIN